MCLTVGCCASSTAKGVRTSRLSMLAAAVRASVRARRPAREDRMEGGTGCELASARTTCRARTMHVHQQVIKP